MRKKQTYLNDRPNFYEQINGINDNIILSYDIDDKKLLLRDNFNNINIDLNSGKEDKSQADITSIQAQLNILEQKLNKTLKPSPETTIADSEMPVNINDNEQDIIVKGETVTTATIIAKSIQIKDFKMELPPDATLTNGNAIYLNTNNDVQIKNTNIEMNKAESSNCVNIQYADSVILKDINFTGTTYNTLMTGQMPISDKTNWQFIKNMLIDNCNFDETCKHFNIWFAGHQDDAVLTISNCHFKTCEQFLCLSDFANTNNKLTVNIINCTIDNYDHSYLKNYDYDYAGFIIIESRNQNSYEEFLEKNIYGNNKVIFNITNLTVAGKKITKDNFNIANGQENQSIYYFCNKYTENNSKCIKYSEQTKHLFPVFNIN